MYRINFVKIKTDWLKCWMERKNFWGTEEIDNYCIRLPTNYVNFILAHNGATLINDVFDFEDPNYPIKNRSTISFGKIEKIIEHIFNLKSGEEPDWPIEYRFEDGLIPFGDNGGGDMICFDYRNDKTTDNPPIVIWNHDMGLKHRVVFIAKNFRVYKYVT